ncbi:hypothetical protein [Streptomyces thioluteus]
MISFVIDGAEFAKAAWNALIFTPARSPIPAAKMYLSGEESYLLATDTYTIGRPSLGPTRGVVRPVSRDLTREDLSRLDKVGRASKGEVRIDVPEDNGLIVNGLQVDVQEVIPDRTASVSYDRSVWDRCRALMERLEREEPSIPELLALDPELLARFGKIKTPKGTTPLLDMRITSPSDPILIRCGPNFMGALMPVDRAVASQAATRGGEFLW